MLLHFVLVLHFAAIITFWGGTNDKQKVANVNVNTVNLPQNSHYKFESQHSSKLYLQYNAFYCFAFLLIQELGIALGCPIEK